MVGDAGRVHADGNAASAFRLSPPSALRWKWVSVHYLAYLDVLGHPGLLEGCRCILI